MDSTIKLFKTILVVSLFALFANSSKAQTNVTLFDSVYVNGTSCILPAPSWIQFTGQVINNPTNADSVYFSIYWGDGTVSSDSLELFSGTTVQNFSSMLVNHSYLLPGSYQPMIVAISANGQSDTVYTQNIFVASSSCLQVSGYVYDDINANCIYEPLIEDSLNHGKVAAFDANNDIIVLDYVGYSGSYSLNIPSNSGTYTIKPIPYYFGPYSANTVDCPVSGAFSFNSNAGTSATVDFGLGCDSTKIDKNVGVEIWPAAPGDTGSVSIWLYASNCGSSVASNDTVNLVLPSEVSYIGMVQGVSPSIINGDTLTWYLSNQTNQFGVNNYLRMEIRTDTAAPLYKDVCAFTYIDESQDDLAWLSNNSGFNCNIIGGPYDPNNKINFPAGVGPQGLTELGTNEITYLINFQNTGTDTAKNINIRDTLSNYFEVGSLNLIGSSHDVEVKFYDLDKVKFDFKNIYLPDSHVNEPLSKGWVLFSLQLKENLPVGTAIENTAHIYFDYNAAIVTNTTINTLHVFPNPPTPLKVDITSRDVTCIENNNGKATINVLSGNPPYTYEWSNAANTNVIDKVGPGIYSFTVTDDSNLVETGQVEIVENRTEESPIIGEIAGTNPAQSWETFYYNTTSSAGHSYEWNAIGGEVLSQQSNSVEIRWNAGPEGQVILSEYDENGCLAIDSLNVGIVFLGVNELQANGINVYPNPTNGFVNIELEESANVELITIYDNSGKIIQTIQPKAHQQIDLSGNSSGVYFLEIKKPQSTLKSQIILK